MGIGPLRFWVAPRVARAFSSHAMSLDHFANRLRSSPVVSSLALYFSIAFGLFLDLVRDALLIRDIVTGVLKSFLIWFAHRGSPAIEALA